MIIILIIAILMIFIIIKNSKIQIEIKNLKISTLKPKGEHINKAYEIIISIVIFNKFKILKITFNHRKIQKLVQKTNLTEKINISQLRIDKNKKALKILKKINIKIKLIQLNLNVGIEDAAATAIITGILASIIGILIENKLEINNKITKKYPLKKLILNEKNEKNKKIEKYYNQNCNYNINPIYIQKNLLEFELNCVLNLKLKI
ncbi:MAG: DUF2953 domain-containing protein [Clostridia bacterium]|nr:DUF2953 domain-containing protein [Clostridia bacterium]